MDRVDRHRVADARHVYSSRSGDHAGAAAANSRSTPTHARGADSKYVSRSAEPERYHSRHDGPSPGMPHHRQGGGQTAPLNRYEGRPAVSTLGNKCGGSTPCKGRLPARSPISSAVSVLRARRPPRLLLPHALPALLWPLWLLMLTGRPLPPPQKGSASKPYGSRSGGGGRGGGSKAHLAPASLFFNNSRLTGPGRASVLQSNAHAQAEAEAQAAAEAAAAAAGYSTSKGWRVPSHANNKGEHPDNLRDGNTRRDGGRESERERAPQPRRSSSHGERQKSSSRGSGERRDKSGSGSRPRQSSRAVSSPSDATVEDLPKLSRHGELELPGGAAVEPRPRTDRGALLRVAAHGGDIVEVARMLKQLDADVDAAAGDGCTALMCACTTDQPDVVRLLLARGARISATNHLGDHALQLAATNGARACVELILAKGGNPNTQNVHGYTALHRAALWGHASTARVLLDAGAKCATQNNKGELPVEICEDRSTRRILNDASQSLNSGDGRSRGSSRSRSRSERV